MGSHWLTDGVPIYLRSVSMSPGDSGSARRSQGDSGGISGASGGLRGS